MAILVLLNFSKKIFCPFSLFRHQYVYIVMFSTLIHFFHVISILGSDHGVKAQGDGWLLTVALIEGSNLAAVDSSGFSDPYVVFTCNGKTRTSSIKFQKSNPTWNGEFFIFVYI